MAVNDRTLRVERIQQIAAVSDVAKALGMALVKRGSSVLTICPFHSDTSPSLNLYDESGGNSHFHCFACGAHGDAFALVQKVRGIDFPNAANWLAQLYGLPSPAAGSNLDSERGTTNARLHGLELAYEIFKKRSDDKLLAEFLTLRKISTSIAADVEILAVRGNSLVNEIQNLKEDSKSWRELQGYLEETGLVRSYEAGWSRSSKLQARCRFKSP